MVLGGFVPITVGDKLQRPLTVFPFTLTIVIWAGIPDTDYEIAGAVTLLKLYTIMAIITTIVPNRINYKILHLASVNY